MSFHLTGEFVDDPSSPGDVPDHEIRRLCRELGCTEIELRASYCADPINAANPPDRS